MNQNSLNENYNKNQEISEKEKTEALLELAKKREEINNQNEEVSKRDIELRKRNKDLERKDHDMDLLKRDYKKKNKEFSRLEIEHFTLSKEYGELKKEFTKDDVMNASNFATTPRETEILNEVQRRENDLNVSFEDLMLYKNRIDAQAEKIANLAKETEIKDKKLLKQAEDYTSLQNDRSNISFFKKQSLCKF